MSKAEDTLRKGFLYKLFSAFLHKQEGPAFFRETNETAKEARATEMIKRQVNKDF